MTDWKEIVAPGEEELFDGLARDLRAVQKKRAPGRALHFKAHGGLLGELTVLGDLPEWARVGIFAASGTFRAYARFSSGAGTAQADAKPDVRGIAVKVVGVPGKKLVPGLEDEATQDFLAILTPTIPFRTPSEFVGVVLAASGSPLLLLPRILGALGFRAFSVLPKAQAGLKRRVGSLSKCTFYSALPIRWGAGAVKYSLHASGDASSSGDEPDRLARDLAACLSKGPIEYDLRVQAFTSEAETPIEDPTVEWKGPWVTVAKLTIPKQDPNSERGKRLATFVEKLSFDPWHAPEEFRPLGAMMRARKAAYRESVMEREAAPEPDGSESWD